MKSRSDAGLPMIIPDASRSYLYTQNENLKKSNFGVPVSCPNLEIQEEVFDIPPQDYQEMPKDAGTLILTAELAGT